MQYDCIIVGGGIAGLQAAIQLGRYGHDLLVVDAGYGRSIWCRSYHNVLGWPDGVAGEQLRRLGRLQAERLGVRFMEGEAVSAGKSEGGFSVRVNRAPDPYGAKPQQDFACRTLLLATGVLDRFPALPGLVPCLGLSVYVCPDCDGYEVKNRRTIVLGSGESGANMAITLTHWTPDIVFINHERKEIRDSTMAAIREKGIEYIAEPIAEVITENEWEFRGVRLKNGGKIAGERGFIAFGGNEVKSALAEQLGVERLENRHIVTDPRTKMTNIPGVWAAGDVAVHAEQVTIAMGEGSQAAIWIHKALQAKKHNAVPQCAT